MTTRAVRKVLRHRGFTLVELMVSLAAGLVVTLGVVALARTATTTFYEQARISTAEAALRTAAERLRQDLTRASYMGTGNIFLAREDSISVPFGHKVAHQFGAVTPSRYAATNDLQGIHIVVGGSLPTADGLPDKLSTTNGLNPDLLELTGNFTTDDAYKGRVTNSGATITLLAANDPAVSRLIAGPNPDLATRNAFLPGTNPGPTPPFMARVVDPRGCQHFVLIADVLGTPLGATINLAPAITGDPVLSTVQDENHTCGVTDGEEVSIPPLQRVRWSIGPTTPLLAPDPAVEAAANKYDLYRDVLDGNGATLPAPGGPQTVAEYATDLKFGITVDDSTVGVVPPNNHKIIDMDDPASPALINAWTANASGTAAAQPAPQRVRSVRFRLAARGSLVDRANPIATPVGTPIQYMYRYCTVPPLAGCTRLARVRTIMSEVPLVNQAGMTY